MATGLGCWGLFSGQNVSTAEVLWYICSKNLKNKFPSYVSKCDQQLIIFVLAVSVYCQTDCMTLS